MPARKSGTKAARATRAGGGRGTPALRDGARRDGALRALADRLGLIPEYTSMTGERVRMSDDTRVALLDVLGVRAATGAEQRQALGELEASERARPLDAARVLVQTAAKPALVARAPEGSRRTLEWSLAIRDESGRTRRSDGRARLSPDGTVRIPLERIPAIGYHRARLALDGGEPVKAEQRLIVVPASCPSPAERLQGQRVAGLTVNLYSVRGSHGWGVGDVADLADVVSWAHECGLGFVGLNPLHALRNRGADVSPYSPVSRLWRNVLYLNVGLVPELAETPAAADILASASFQGELGRLRAVDRVDYEGVIRLQRPVLERLFDTFVTTHADAATPRGVAWRRWREEQGEALERFVTFVAVEEWLREREGDAAPGWWREWPEELRSPSAPGIAEFRGRERRRVDFHAWLQFELDRQIGSVASLASDLGLPVGLYQDLAIGSAPSGADAWSFPDLFASGASVGAPPDPYSDTGQNWGLPPLDPHRLAARGYDYWIDLVRSALRHSGALRIDHVMGLFRQFWIPEGKDGKSGGYVRFPSDDLLGILALESTRAGALVVGEDLGTVPPDVPPAMHRWGILSSKVLYFERMEEGRFRPPLQYPRMALATANTHDMATLAGFWAGRDVELRREHGLVKGRAAREAERERVNERRDLLAMLRGQGLIASTEDDEEIDDLELRAAVHAMMRRSPSWLVGLSLDDLAGETEGVNLPGVGADRYPSWTKRIRRPLDELRRAPDVRRALGLERWWVPGAAKASDDGDG